MAAVTGKIARERTTIWAIGGFAVANLLCAAAPSFALLIAARIVAGLCAALYTPSAYALAVALAAPERRGRALSAVVMGISTATVFGVPLGTVIGHGFGWHATFILIAVVSAVAMVALRLARMRSPPASLATAGGVVARLAPLARAAIVLVLLPNLIWGLGSMLVYTYIAPILGPYFDAGTIAVLLLLYGCGGLLGSIIGGRVADRFGPVRPMVVCIAAGAINLSVWGLVNGNLVANAIVMFIYALAGWTIGAPQQMRVIRIDPSVATVTLAVNNAVFYLGNALGAGLGGLLVTAIPPVDLTFVGTGFATLTLGVVLLSARRRTA